MFVLWLMLLCEVVKNAVRAADVGMIPGWSVQLPNGLQVNVWVVWLPHEGQGPWMEVERKFEEGRRSYRTRYTRLVGR
jgi:hypothetical protein